MAVWLEFHEVAAVSYCGGPERPWNGLRQTVLHGVLQKTKALAVLHNLQFLYLLFGARAGRW